jgi:hypothetical protein
VAGVLLVLAVLAVVLVVLNRDLGFRALIPHLFLFPDSASWS